MLDLENETTGQLPFFRNEYTNEVKLVELSIHNHSNTFGSFDAFLQRNRDLGRQAIQHIYIFDENAFNKLKKSYAFQRINQSERHDERDAIYQQFYSSINDKYWKLDYENRPEFGACDKCWKYLDRKQKKSYSKLKNKKEEFWDWTKW